MKSPLKPLLILLTCTAALAGCGESSPTDPGAGGPESKGSMYTQVRFDAVVVYQDGDLVGQGEFEFRWGVNEHQAFRAVGLGKDDAWDPPYKGWGVEGAGSSIDVYFEASEWDVDVLGRDVRDSDMNRRHKTVKHTVGSEPDLKQYSIVLGNDDCKVQMLYTLQTFIQTP